jgi:hypothetical protein
MAKREGSLTKPEAIDESVYSSKPCKYIQESDADILQILNGEPEPIGFAGIGANNEFALNEVSQWLEDRHMNHVPFRWATCRDVTRQYLMVGAWSISQPLSHGLCFTEDRIRYGGALVAKDDKNLVATCAKSPRLTRRV